MLARKLYSWSYRVREETGKSHGVTELEKRQESLMELTRSRGQAEKLRKIWRRIHTHLWHAYCEV